MAHFVEKSDIIRIVRGKLVYSVYGTWKKHTIEIYRETLDGKYYSDRYEQCTTICGYTYQFAGEKERTYYCSESSEIKKNYLVESYKHNHYVIKSNIYDSKCNLIDYDPASRYLCQKTTYKNGIGIDTRQLWELYKVWLKHPECEALAEMQLYNLAVNPKTYTNKNKKNVIVWLKHNKCDQYTTLRDVQLRMKYNLTTPELEAYKKVKNIDVVRYLIKQVEKDSESWKVLDKEHRLHQMSVKYIDYISQVKNINQSGLGYHDLEDDYWKYPPHLVQMEDRVKEEYANILRTKELERNKKLIEELEKKVDFKVFKKLKKKTQKVINGYTIYTPDDLNDIAQQASELNQCLITSAYDEKMLVKKKTILVFIKKDGKPIATAELNFDKKVEQFYGDEHDRENCAPSEEVKSAFNQWLGMVNINERMLYTQ